MTLELSSLQPSCADLLHRFDVSITVMAQLPELQALPPDFSPLDISSTLETNSASRGALLDDPRAFVSSAFMCRSSASI